MPNVRYSFGGLRLVSARGDRICGPFAVPPRHSRSPSSRWGPDPGPRRVDCSPLKTSHLAITALVSASTPASSALRPWRLTKAAWPLAHGSGHGVAA
jgi:hypothetical protein